MKQSDKYTIAWFKLADCVVRGERERALGVYRLLSHSFDDQALAHQLAGDLHLSFNERVPAIDKYAQAAQIYEQSGRFLEAAAVYEHIITLDPQLDNYRIRLIDVYKKMDIITKVLFHIQYLFDNACITQQWDKALEMINVLDQACYMHDMVRLYEQLIQAMHQLRISIVNMQPYIVRVVTLLINNTDEKLMQRFLTTMRALDEQLYTYAKERLVEIL